jgi:hypothetical protein
MNARRRGTCAICGRPFRAGQDTERARLVPADQRTRVVHERCLRDDWPRVELGLEAFEPLERPR